MKRSFVYVVALIALFGCGQHEKANRHKPLPGIKNEIVQARQTDKKDSLKPSLSPGADKLVFNLTIDSASHSEVSFNITSGKNLFASLTSADKNANIRVNQIEFPDSTFDGPFGRELKYPLKNTGTYKIIIGENMMAGDRWNGSFTLKVWVK